MTPSRKVLRAAYRAAIYRVIVGERHYDLHFGITDGALLNELCDAVGSHCHWAILTPYYPASTVLSTAENRRRLKQLQATVRQRDVISWPTLHRDPAGHWPDERGLLLCDPPAGWVMALARHYGQHAYVVGGRWRRPRLRWCQAATPATG